MFKIMAAELKRVSFNKEERRDFNTVLRERVNLFFKESKLSPKGTASMVFKTLFLIATVASIYLLLLFGGWMVWAAIALYSLLGFCIAVCAMNISHDALHGAYVSNSVGNRCLGLIMDMCGASSFYWRKEHTVDHHTFTNIAGLDADLNAPILLRLCPEAPHRKFQRFQHWYALILYSFNLMRWIYFSDIKRIYWVFKSKDTPKPPLEEIIFLFLFKVIHIALFLVTPMVYLPLPWWQVLLGYTVMLATTGLTMTVIFQLAHIVENVAFPLPDVEGKMENSFATHQLETTSNFATRNKLVGFLFGGLNFQVEHHLFPHVCHMHLHKIAPIVKSTAAEFGVRYHENPSFFAALKSHFSTLKRLGHSP
jgi:linoleoyl-CoA desaturase